MPEGAIVAGLLRPSACRGVGRELLRPQKVTLDRSEPVSGMGFSPWRLLEQQWFVNRGSKKSPRLSVCRRARQVWESLDLFGETSMESLSALVKACERSTSSTWGEASCFQVPTAPLPEFPRAFSIFRTQIFDKRVTHLEQTAADGALTNVDRKVW